MYERAPVWLPMRTTRSAWRKGPSLCCSDYLPVFCSRLMAVPIAQARWRSEEGRPSGRPA